MTTQPHLHSPLYVDALSWAAQLHRYQRRKGKPVPYISHLIAVSGLVWDDGGTEDQAIAGLLHDSIEDAGQSHVSIAERCGEGVASIVLDCTDNAAGLSGAGNEPWLVRKTRYVASLEHKSETSVSTTLMPICPCRSGAMPLSPAGGCLAQPAIISPTAITSTRRFSKLRRSTLFCH